MEVLGQGWDMMLGGEGNGELGREGGFAWERVLEEDDWEVARGQWWVDGG